MLKEIADSVRLDAVRVIENSITAEDDDKDLKEMWNEDAKDIIEIANLIEQNNIKEAAKQARHMDTAAREQINATAWDFMLEGE